MLHDSKWDSGVYIYKKKCISRKLMKSSKDSKLTASIITLSINVSVLTDVAQLYKMLTAGMSEWWIFGCSSSFETSQ